MRLLPSAFSSHTSRRATHRTAAAPLAWSETDRRFKTSSRYVRLKRSMKAFCTGLPGRMYLHRGLRRDRPGITDCPSALARPNGHRSSKPGAAGSSPAGRATTFGITRKTTSRAVVRPSPPRLRHPVGARHPSSRAGIRRARYGSLPETSATMRSGLLSSSRNWLQK
jgi:hypothetical protein